MPDWTMAHFLTLRSWDMELPLCPHGPTGQGMGQLWASGPTSGRLDGLWISPWTKWHKVGQDLGSDWTG